MSRLGCLRCLLLVVVAQLAACREVCEVDGPPPDLAALQSPFAGYRSERYAGDDLWLCLPGKDGDVCAQDLDATELLADGSRRHVAHVPHPSPSVDCFYVYPTMDWVRPPGLVQDLERTGPEEEATVLQGARFTEVCRVFAPLYRQMTLSTYFGDTDVLEQCSESAFSDVLEAFLHYMGQHNDGRPVVLIGHSQGAQHVITLLQRVFDEDALMRSRLVAALPIGFPMTTKIGEPAGGTLKNVPICRARTEKGCILTYRSHPDGKPPPDTDFAPDGEAVPCVMPGNPAVEDAPMTRSFFRATALGIKLRKYGDVDTPFVLYRDYFYASCQDNDEGRYLAIRADPDANDARPAPVDLERQRKGDRMGLHNEEMSITLGDLIDVVKAKAAQP